MISAICASLRLLYGWLLFELGLDFLGFFSAIQVFGFVRLFQDKTLCENKKKQPFTTALF